MTSKLIESNDGWVNADYVVKWLPLSPPPTDERPRWSLIGESGQVLGITHEHPTGAAPAAEAKVKPRPAKSATKAGRRK